ncbi:DMBT1 protein, partial [Bucco capensis]|nr:DMBT1 protein [Bucco capensis]
ALLCYSSYMRAIIDRRYLEQQGYLVWNITLPDSYNSYCRPTITSTQVVFNILYNSCGTRIQV